MMKGIKRTVVLDVCDYDKNGDVTKGIYRKRVWWFGIKVIDRNTRLNTNRKLIEGSKIGLRK